MSDDHTPKALVINTEYLYRLIEENADPAGVLAISTAILVQIVDDIEAAGVDRAELADRLSLLAQQVWAPHPHQS